MEPRFLLIDEVIEIQEDQVIRYGGTFGVRDRGLLESAVMAPRATFGGQLLHADLFEMAAAYLCYLVGDHPFVDGNKRTWAVAAVVFLALNDHDLAAEEDLFEALVRGVAEGRVGKAGVAAFLRANDRPSAD
jgi:death on curing protein